MNRRTRRLAALLLAVLLGAGTVSRVQAQTAQDYFHDGAGLFIGESLDEAASTVDTGLRAHPDDAQLQALSELIRQAQEQQQQQNQGQNDQQEQSEDQQSQDENNGEQGDPGDQQEEGEQSQSDQQNEEEQPKDEQEQDGENPEDGEQQESQAEDGSDAPAQEVPVDPDRLSEEEAERILQALANEEEQLLREIQKIKGRPRRVEKDW